MSSAMSLSASDSGTPSSSACSCAAIIDLSERDSLRADMARNASRRLAPRSIWRSEVSISSPTGPPSAPPRAAAPPDSRGRRARSRPGCRGSPAGRARSAPGAAGPRATARDPGRTSRRAARRPGRSGELPLSTSRSIRPPASAASAALRPMKRCTVRPAGRPARSSRCASASRWRARMVGATRGPERAGEAADQRARPASAVPARRRPCGSPAGPAGRGRAPSGCRRGRRPRRGSRAGRRGAA